MQRDLLRWYRQHGRRLPWRMSGDPYRIWVSEIMLQQTTVAAVVPYFERFLTRFPTVHELAAAHEQDVLRLWEGLGYYSRGRNLHAAARQLVAQSAGQKLFPQTVADWRAILDRDCLGPAVLPLPHPSWRNSAWLKANPWFDADVVPVLRRRVRSLLR